LNNPAHRHLRTQKARLLALPLKDPEANAAVLKIVEEYDHPSCPAEQINKGVPPVSASEPMSKSIVDETSYKRIFDCT